MDKDSSWEDVPTKKTSSKKWLTALLIVVVFIAGTVLFQSINNDKKLYTLQNNLTLANYPGLGLLPVQLDLSGITAADAQTFNYYGVTFAVPWSEKPNVITDSDGGITQLQFPAGESITIGSSSSYANIANELATTPGVSSSSLQKIYGEQLSPSDYNFLMAALNSVPSSTSAIETALVTIKYSFLGFSGTSTPTAIYNFSLPTVEGFQLVSTNQVTNQAYRINFLFTPQGVGAHDFTIGNATQDEANQILASIRREQSLPKGNL